MLWSPCGRRRGGAQRGVAMAELQQLRVQEAVDSMVKSLERENIRKMQVVERAGRCEGSPGGPGLPAPSRSRRARPRAADPLPADPGQGGPGVAAASSEARLAHSQNFGSCD